MRDSKTRREGRQEREVEEKGGKLLKYGGKMSKKKNGGFQFLEKLFFKFYGVKTKYSAGEVQSVDFARQLEGKESIRRAKGGQGGKHGKNVRAVGQTLYRWVPHPAAHGQVLFVMSGPCLLRHDPRRVHPGKDCGRMAHHLPHTAEAVNVHSAAYHDEFMCWCACVCATRRRHMEEASRCL